MYDPATQRKLWYQKILSIKTNSSVTIFLHAVINFWVVNPKQKSSLFTVYLYGMEAFETTLSGSESAVHRGASSGSWSRTCARRPLPAKHPTRTNTKQEQHIISQSKQTQVWKRIHLAHQKHTKLKQKGTQMNPKQLNYLELKWEQTQAQSLFGIQRHPKTKRIPKNFTTPTQTRSDFLAPNSTWLFCAHVSYRLRLDQLPVLSV